MPPPRAQESLLLRWCGYVACLDACRTVGKLSWHRGPRSSSSMGQRMVRVPSCHRPHSPRHRQPPRHAVTQQLKCMWCRGRRGINKGMQSLSEFFLMLRQNHGTVHR